MPSIYIIPIILYPQYCILYPQYIVNTQLCVHEVRKQIHQNDPEYRAKLNRKFIRSDVQWLS